MSNKNLKHLNRRGFVRNLTVGVAAAGTTTFLGSFRDPVNQAKFNPVVDPDDLKITDLKLIRLKFPGVTPRKWNSIIVSGGGQHSMRYLEIYTNQGIVGRSIPMGIKSITLGLLKKIKGENPFDVYGQMVDSAFGSSRALSETLITATPLILTGVAAAIAFRLFLV